MSILTGRKKKALAALLTASTVQTAAAQAKVPYSSVRRWLTSDKEFRAEYDAMLRELVESAATQARQGMTEAVSVLREIMADVEAAPNVKVQAARTILDSGGRLLELQSLEGRMAELERLVLEDKS